jgi:hypothetical protein
MRTQKETNDKNRHGIDVDACDWCTLSYPESAKERFYSIKVIDSGKLVLHKICGDCYNRLKEVHP